MRLVRLIRCYEGHSQPSQRRGRMGPKLPLSRTQNPSRQLVPKGAISLLSRLLLAAPDHGAVCD